MLLHLYNAKCDSYAVKCYITSNPKLPNIAMLYGAHCKCIGSASQKYNWPKRSNWQQHLLMQLAHLSASAVPPRNLMGPIDAIGSSIRQCNSPISLHSQYLPETSSAKHTQ